MNERMTYSQRLTLGIIVVANLELDDDRLEVGLGEVERQRVEVEVVDVRGVRHLLALLGEFEHLAHWQLVLELNLLAFGIEHRLQRGVNELHILERRLIDLVGLDDTRAANVLTQLLLCVLFTSYPPPQG